MSIIIIVLILCLGIQWYYGFRYLRPILQKTPVHQQPSTKLPHVSLLICAKNEINNLKKHHAFWLNQLYPSYDVYIVDDASLDGSLAYLQSIQIHFPHLEVRSTRQYPTDLKGKKGALAYGLTQINSEWIALTDADCLPQSPEWLQRMLACATPDTKIIHAYAPYYPRAHVLNAFIRFETMFSFWLNTGFNNAGIHYTAVGRNMVVQKELLNRPKPTHYNAIPSGDDDLLVNNLHETDRMAFNWHPHTFVYSEAENHWADWQHQKQRHLSAGKYYKRRNQLLIGAYALSQGLCNLGILILPFVCTHNWAWALWLSLLMRSIMFAMMAKKAADKLLENFVFFQIIGLDFLWSLYNLYFAPYIFFKNQSKWKSSKNTSPT